MPGPLWPASWLLAFAIVVAGVAGWEVFWRERGFVPAVSDDVHLWAVARREATELGDRAVVLVGSSRMQMDFHRESLSMATGWDPAIQLAVVRGPSIPVLQNLAQDPEFRGLVLCEVNPLLFYVSTPKIDRSLDHYFLAYRGLTPVKRFEASLSMWFQYTFVSRLPALAPSRLWGAWKAGRYPLPVYDAEVTPFRYRSGNFALLPALDRLNRANAESQNTTPPRPMPEGELDMRLLEVEVAVAAIRERGGHVVFLQLPSSLHVLEFENRWWKRERYWDRLVAQTSADAIHYRDYELLSQFEPPDGHHLGRDEAIAFSSALGRVLVQRGIAPGGRIR